MPGKDLVIAAVITVAIHFVVAFVHIPALFTLPEINKINPLKYHSFLHIRELLKNQGPGYLKQKRRKTRHVTVKHRY